MSVIVRFAPSPTGYLHIGGARTALFNWLFARHHGGKFMLRIEDTDRQRSIPSAITAIIEGLKWFGLDWDGEIVMQSERLARHAAVAAEMLARGTAYRCYCSPAELDAMRERQRAEGRPLRYEGIWRDRVPASHSTFSGSVYLGIAISRPRVPASIEIAPYHEPADRAMKKSHETWLLLCYNLCCGFMWGAA